MQTNHLMPLDLSRFVSIGDSITSGYTDGALFYEGQLHAFSNLMAQQFKTVGGGNFNQPLMKPDSVGVGFYGNARLAFKNKSDTSNNQQAPEYIAKQGDLSVFIENIFAKQGPFHNMSVPSAKLISLVKVGIGNPKNGVGNYNPFFTRMASHVESASILSDALALDPTFFTLFIGNNDVLTYASSGGTMDIITPSEGIIGVGFNESLSAVVNALIERGAKGAISNLGNITSVPYFTVISFDGLLLTKVEAEQLTTLYSEFGLTFHEGRNPFVIADPSANSKGIRQINKGELIMLEIQLDPNKNNYLKAETPIPKKYVLTISEISKITEALTSYNDAIEQIAIEKKLAFIDVNSFTKTLKTDISYDEVNRCATYHENRIFSLDGLHLNARGQALLANLFIKEINETYDCSIAFVPDINHPDF